MSDVVLTVNEKICTMDNGILSIIWKEDASADSIKLYGTELLYPPEEQADPTTKKRSFYVDYHAEGKFRKFHTTRLDIITDTKEMAHIAYIDDTGLLYLEYHIVMMQGVSGVYSYVIAKNNTDACFTLSELRTVYRFGNTIFDHGCNNERIGLQPTHKYMQQFECLQDETYRLPDGERYTNGDVYSKYDYAGYFSKNPAWGQYGHGYGFFVLPICTDYYPSGPLKQELLIHYDGIVLNYFTGAHFGTGPMHVPLDFQKCYGPFFLCFNKGDDGEKLFKEAKELAETEKAKWPYAWAKNPLYPLERSTVSGTLSFSNTTPCKNTTVILAGKDLPFERQSDGYRYSTVTDENGYFSLNHVRYGSYTLFAYQTGGSVTDQLQIDSVLVSQGDTRLGDLAFPIVERKLLWQLGTATRTCEGFRFAGELRNYKWSTMVPENLTFCIGKDDPSKDWYYAQTKTGAWNLLFNLEPEEDANYILTIALAGISSASMTDRMEPLFQVFLNDVLLTQKVYLNDTTIYRSSTTNGRYRRLTVPIKANQLVNGMNTLSFHNEHCMVMYDTILLEQE